MAKPQHAIPVHALDDQRIHLAPPHHGRLAQGRLKTLCGKLAVTALPLFSPAAGNRCKACFAMVDADGFVKADSRGR